MATSSRIDIGYAPIARFFAVLLLLVFFFLVRDILAILFIAFLISSGLNPLVDWMHRIMPRVLAVTLIYMTMVLSLLAFIVVLNRTVIADFTELTSKITLGEFNTFFLGFELDFAQISDRITSTLTGEQLSTFISGAKKFLTGVTSIFLIFVLSFYMMLEKNGLKNALRNLMPKRAYEHMAHLLEKIEIKVGSWLRGELILMLFIGTVTYAALKILGMPYAAVLAIIAGFTEIIPGVGPILSGIIGTLIAVVVFPAEPVRWLVVAGVYIVIQQLENQFLVPQVMKRVLGLSPIVVLTSILIGAKLLGVVGAFLAVPAAAALAVVVQEWESALRKAKAV